MVRKVRLLFLRLKHKENKIKKNKIKNILIKNQINFQIDLYNQNILYYPIFKLNKIKFSNKKY